MYVHLARPHRPLSFSHVSRARPRLHMLSRVTRPAFMSTVLNPSDFPNLSFRDDKTSGERFCHYEFKSEPLGMPVADGYGYAEFDFGDTIGDINAPERYTIVRKLGWTGLSSIWLARDNERNIFVAIKVATGFVTEKAHKPKISWELDAMDRVSQPPPSKHCAILLHPFVIEPPRGRSGLHLCCVMPLYGGDLLRLTKARKHGPFPYPLAKRIILHILRGLAHIHGRGFVHTDLKHDNIFYTTGATPLGIERWLQNHPSQKHPPELSHGNTIVQAAVSQPLPLPTEELLT